MDRRLFSNENDDKNENIMMIMEKKKYIAPECVVVEVEAVSVLAVSVPIGDDKPENDIEDMANRHRGEWGNLWK